MIVSLQMLVLQQTTKVFSTAVFAERGQQIQLRHETATCRAIRCSE